MKSLEKVPYRRITLTIVAALFGLTPIEVFGQRIRQNYRNLTPAARQKFRDALVAMKGATGDTGGLWTCSAGIIGKICSTNFDCGVGGTCDMTQPVLCEWANKYDKYVCWHDRCG